MISKGRDLERVRNTTSRAMAVWEQGQRFQIVGAPSRHGPRATVWAPPYQTLSRVPHNPGAGASDDVKVPSRFALAMREVAALLIATSGVVAVVVIVMVVTLMLRALRALCGR